ncbi:MAG: terminase large subunit domain-containing protein [Acidiferrobacteraceae bacterium]
MDRQEALALVNEKRRRAARNRLAAYTPYTFQARLHAASAAHQQILLCAANRIGKSYGGAMELAFHMTGLYPEWWEGRKHERPISCWAAGTTNEKTRDILQAALLGDPKNPAAFGTGAVPGDLVTGTMRKPGIPAALSSFTVRHVSGGNSVCAFKAYEMGAEAFMGESLDIVWLDEEPDEAIYSQCVIRVLDRQGYVYMTFTPEKGGTSLVQRFMEELGPGQLVLNGTWDEAPHLDAKAREQALAAIPEYEREMRSKGVVRLGSGNVFRVQESTLRVDPFDIPTSFYWIGGMDFGMDHPTAFVKCALDRDTKTFYVVDCYRQSDKILSVYVKDGREFFGSINVAWPHDGRKRDPGSGDGLAMQYRRGGIRMLPTHFSNPPGIGQHEGQGGFSIEPGIQAMESAMTAGRFKVFDTPANSAWFQEYRMYHRNDGNIIDVRDDLMAATRYAFQSTRFARTKERPPLATSYLTDPPIELRS